LCLRGLCLCLQGLCLCLQGLCLRRLSLCLRRLCLCLRRLGRPVLGRLLMRCPGAVLLVRPGPGWRGRRRWRWRRRGRLPPRNLLGRLLLPGGRSLRRLGGISAHGGPPVYTAEFRY
jgi:hypothetical protein